jgi:hypothetical protein
LIDVVDGSEVDIKAAAQKELVREQNKKSGDLAMEEEKKRIQSLAQHETMSSAANLLLNMNL